MPALGQQIWTKPVYPHPDDEEFEGDYAGFDWSITIGATPASFSFDSVKAYDSSFTTGTVVRATLNPKNRKSWLLLQAPSTGSSFQIYKPYTPPENVLIVARMKFNQYYSLMTNNDRSIAFALSGESGGLPSAASDWVAFYLNETDTAYEVASEFIVRENTTYKLRNNTTSASNGGQALEYMAIHKIGTTYHGYAGTASGNWIWMGSSINSNTLSYMYIGVLNTSSSNPGPGVVGVDFIRFYETDNFLF